MHQLEGGDQPTGPLGQQPLVDDGQQRAGQLDLDLGAAVGGEDVDDAVDGLGRVVGVQRGEDQVAGLGDGQGGRMVSRSRISPTRMTSGSWRRAERRASAKDSGVGAHLALAHGRRLVG